MEAMADALLSGLASTILDKLNTLVVGESAGALRTELELLQSQFSTIKAVLKDAEQKQRKSEAVSDWLRKLKDAAYDVDDVLDEFAIEAQKRRLPMDLKSRVKHFFSAQNPLVFRMRMAYVLNHVEVKLEAIANERHKFHFAEGVDDLEMHSLDWKQTSSLVNESEIFGREEEKEELTNMLLSSTEGFLVCAICGIGGLGKTTLAQLVYNDGRVEKHFDKRIWVCLSDDFDVRRLTRAILESIEGRSCNIQELDPLQRRLQEELSGKRFLLVLDDVWDEYHDRWNKVKDALRSGAKGSAIMVTTRIEKVALKMATAPVHHIARLTDNASWSLFDQRAFQDGNRGEYAHLEPIGRAVVRKCVGVPLAIKALGSLLRFRRSESEWLSIRDSEIWDLPDEGRRILSTLRLSYDHLPPQLKQCFAFCSIFPEDYIMKKDQLIQLWIANGFVFPRGQMDFHDTGNEIFNELVWRSFFQDVREEFGGDITCKMHDLVHDLARSIMIHECSFIQPDGGSKVPRKVRHLTVHGRSVQNVPFNKDILKLQSLRSFLMFDARSWSDILNPNFIGHKHLRAFGISGYRVNELPMSIGKLKHLRYLDASRSWIKSLPESVTSLQNLQTLNLTECSELCTLPKGMRHMKNLMYLDIRGCEALTSMPAGMGQLTCLRKLSIFIVGNDEGRHIQELKELNLGGELSIKGLDNVKNLKEAESGNLKLKKDLFSLKLSWQDNSDGVPSENDEQVVCGLEPHSQLKQLSISRYRGLRFPNWMMDLHLPNLVEVSLEHCHGCECLPPFGKLQFLKVLHLKGMIAVKYLDSGVYGDFENPFPCLEWLTLESMSSLEEWPRAGDREIFCHLEILHVVDCPKLVELPIIPSVKHITIGSNEVLLKSVMKYTFLTTLHIQNFPELTVLPDGFLQNHINLESLFLYKLPGLESLSNQLDNLHALKKLDIVDCGKLETLPIGLRNLSSLEWLLLLSCGLVSLPSDGLSGLSSLRCLVFQHCGNFESRSEGLGHLKALEDLSFLNCPKLSSLPESIGQLASLRSLKFTICDGLSSLPIQIENLASLACLEIQACPGLRSFPEEIQNLRSLRELIIGYCPHLEKRCKKLRGEDWPKIAHIPNIIINHQVIQSSDY